MDEWGSVERGVSVGGGQRVKRIRREGGLACVVFKRDLEDFTRAPGSGKVTLFAICST